MADNEIPEADVSDEGCDAEIVVSTAIGSPADRASTDAPRRSSDDTADMSVDNSASGQERAIIATEVDDSTASLPDFPVVRERVFSSIDALRNRVLDGVMAEETVTIQSYIDHEIMKALQGRPPSSTVSYEERVKILVSDNYYLWLRTFLCKQTLINRKFAHRMQRPNARLKTWSFSRQQS